MTRTAAGLPLRASVDLAAFPPVEDHQRYPTCAAAVTAGLAAFHAYRVSGRVWRPSVLFNYVTSQVVGDFVRGEGSRVDWCLAAWRRFGIPDENSWPFEETALGRLPDARAFSRAKAYRGIGYHRLDGADTAPEECLRRIRAHLASGAPVTLDYPLNPAQADAGRTGLLPALAPGAEHYARHVVLVVAYDDERPAGRAPEGGHALRGALRVRNSWGTGWGEEGHAWLPYQYVLARLTRHHWTVRIAPGGHT
ncbi:C1 family peptidase [Streptomyces sp. S.PNR 29]|uniref:C1 family peptidase n=1 Tax=Streptomyces sp. S.PNR 29 TaxID=2973805 RepID=UPI0025B25F67|nr:C1 family peptidase [Streptomyces sp. S.PNR 29]MDN0195312.1 C1 family peptidase [Streptomyces sp. S.PNR 29]